MKESGQNNTMVLQFISTVHMWMTHFAYSTTKRMLWNFSIISTINTFTLHSIWTEMEVNHKVPFLDVLLDNSNPPSPVVIIFFTFSLQIKVNSNAGGQDI